MRDLKEQILDWLREEGIESDDISPKQKEYFEPMLGTTIVEKPSQPKWAWAIRIKYKNRYFILQKGGQDWLVLYISVTLSPEHRNMIGSNLQKI